MKIDEMNHAGILAHSPDGAALAFTEFCHAGHRHFGAALHPNVTLDYVAMGLTLPAWERGDVSPIRNVLAESVQRLADAGASYFFCPDNTAHIALEFAGPDLAIPGLNLPDIVAGKAKELGLRKIGLLGTRFSMNAHCYPRALGALGLDWEIPDVNDCEYVNKAIFEELVNGVFRDETRRVFCEIIAKLERQGCDGVALACTEIPLLISQSDASIALLDSTKLLSVAAFEVGIGAAEFPSWHGGPPRG